MMSKEERLQQKKIREREEQKYMQMTEDELWRELFTASQGSLKVKAIHKALKQYGDGVAFSDRYPDVIGQILRIICVILIWVYFVVLGISITTGL